MNFDPSAADRLSATNGAQAGNHHTKSSPAYGRKPGKRLDVGKLRHALANPPLVAGLLSDLRHEPSRNELAQRAADAAAEVASIEMAIAATTDPAEKARLFESLADALGREVIALDDAIRAIGGGT